MSQEKPSPTGLTSSSAGNDTCVVICNGPSLASVPNEWLERFPTFGSNRVWLKYSPDVLCLLDIKMVHNKSLTQEALESFGRSKEVYLSRDAYVRMGEPELGGNVTILASWANVTDDSGQLMGSFSTNPPELLVSGGTVTYGLLQLAYWKGFKKVLMVGLNHTFRDSRGDHFTDDYNREV